MKKFLPTRSSSIFIFAILMTFAQSAWSQNCSITTTGNFCVGSPITFYCNTQGGSNYLWNFNSEGSNTSACNPNFTFNTPGQKTIQLNMKLANGNNCNSSVQIYVSANPIVRFKRLSNKTQCFRNNRYCFVDSSVSANPNSGNICERIVVFDDGTKYTQSGTAPWSFCHSFQDPAGGTYGLTMQVIDCSGCTTTVRQNAIAVVLPSLDLRFSSLQPKRCDSVQLCVTNLSSVSIDSLKFYKWIWGDGQQDSGNRLNQTFWKNNIPNGVCHWYKTQGPNSGGFDVKLIGLTNAGCRDTFVYNNAASNLKIQPRIVANFDSVCYANASIKFKLKDGAIPFASNPLYVFENPPQPTNISRNWEAEHRFKSLGPQQIKFSFTHSIPGCGRTIYDTVLVLGPQSIIEGSAMQGYDFMPPERGFQCVIQDTVAFSNFSQFYHNDRKFADDDSTYLGQGFNAPLVHAFGSNNTSLKASKQNRGNSCVNRIWDFDDPYCEACTTDTKNGINVGRNCRYSKDSLPQHAYTDWDQVYEQSYLLKPYNIYRYNQDSAYSYARKLWAEDSIAILRDTIVYYGDNPLAIKTKDSLIYKNFKKVKMPSGIKGISNTYFKKAARFYLPAGDTAWINLNNNLPSTRYIGPRYINLQANSNLILSSLSDQVYYGVWIEYSQDTIPMRLLKGRKAFKTMLNPAIKPGDSIQAAVHRQRFYASEVVRCFAVKLTQNDVCHPMACAHEVVKTLSFFPPNAKNLRKKGIECLGSLNDQYGLTFILDDSKANCAYTWAEINFETRKNPQDWQVAIGKNLSPGNISMGGLPPVNPPYQVPIQGYKNNGAPGQYYSKSFSREDLTDTLKGTINVGLIVGNGIWSNGNYPSSCVDTCYYNAFAQFPILDNSLEIVNLKEGSNYTKICKDKEIALSLSKNNYSDVEQVSMLKYHLMSDKTGKYYNDTKDYQVIEKYKRFQSVPGNPGFLMDYLEVVKSVSVNLRSTTLDSVYIPIARINQWHYEADVSAVYDAFKQRCSNFGLDIHQLSARDLALIIWNGKGSIGKAYTGSRGFIDTTGIGNLILFKTIADNKTTLHFRDTSLLPIDKTLSYNNKMRNAYTFKPNSNGFYVASLQVFGLNPNMCPANMVAGKKVLVGYYSVMNYLDTIICHGQQIVAEPEFRYFEVFPEITFRTTDPVDYWRDRISEAGNPNREGYTRHDLNKDDDGSNVRSTFGGWPYSVTGLDNMPGNRLMLGGGTSSVYYSKDTGAAYLIRTASSDSTGCFDTIAQYVYTTAARAHFKLDQSRPQCNTLIEFFDSSYIIDPLIAKTGKATDQIIKWKINWGDQSDEVVFFNSLPNNIGHAYPKNGRYRIRLSVESALGCSAEDSMDIYIPGPIAKFDTLPAQKYCINKKIYFKNQSQYTRRDSCIWVWDFGDNTFETQKDTVTNAADTMGHVYPNAGTYSVKMTLFYQLFNGKSCSVSYPDTSLGQAPMLLTIEKCSSSSINSNALNNKVKLYPNPALNKVSIECKEKTEILVYDSRGALVDEITCEGLKTFDLKHLGSGLYFFISKENQLLGKLIVE